MKTAVNILGVFLMLVYLPMGWYMQYLLYSHVHATDLMWFLFVVNIPFSLISALVGQVITAVNKK